MKYEDILRAAKLACTYLEATDAESIETLLIELSDLRDRSAGLEASNRALQAGRDESAAVFIKQRDEIDRLRSAVATHRQRLEGGST